MNDTDRDSMPGDSGAPFGTQPRRSSAALFLFGALYVACLLTLLWMARSQSGG
jgi:hypothetical protein